jgi:hypothetical protein
MKSRTMRRDYCVLYYYVVVHYDILDLFEIFVVSYELRMCIEKLNWRTRDNARAFVLVP